MNNNKHIKHSEQCSSTNKQLLKHFYNLNVFTLLYKTDILFLAPLLSCSYSTYSAALSITNYESNVREKITADTVQVRIYFVVSYGHWALRTLCGTRGMAKTLEIERQYTRNVITVTRMRDDDDSSLEILWTVRWGNFIISRVPTARNGRNYKYYADEFRSRHARGVRDTCYIKKVIVHLNSSARKN